MYRNKWYFTNKKEIDVPVEKLTKKSDVKHNSMVKYVEYCNTNKSL